MRRIVVLGSLVAAATGAVCLSPAQAQTQLITATVAASVGVGIDGFGNVLPGGSTTSVAVTRERHGNTVTITVMPRD